jgi:hypothetical protein
VADQKRKLVIEVLGNAKDAAKALGDVRSDTDRAAERFTNFGQVTLAASAVGAVGLYKLANAAGDYGEAQSAASVIFGDAVDIVTEFGEAASETAGMSKKAAVDGANTFGTFGKSAGLAGVDLAGFSTEMVQLAGDLASFKNTTPEQAIQAIGSALRGESEPIRAYGVLLDEATLKQRAMTMGIADGTAALTPQQKVLAAQAEILAQTSDAQGDYSRTSDSLANQQRTLTAEFENLKVGIGQGVLPMMSSLVGGASDVLGKFSELSPETQNLLGKLGGIVVTGGLVVGALSLVAGKVLEARDRFTTLGTDGTRSMNNVGKAAAGLTTIIAGIAIAEAIGAASNQIGDYAQKAEDALNRTREALLDEDDGRAVQEFANTVAETQAEWTGLGEIWGSVGREFTVASTGIQADVENVDLAFQRMLESSPQAAEDLVAALERQLETLDPTSREYSDTADMVDRFKERLDAASTATSVATRETENLTGATGDAGGAIEETASELVAAEPGFDTFMTALSSSAELASGLSSVLDELFGPKMDLEAATAGWEAALDKLSESIKANGTSLDITTDKGRANREMLVGNTEASLKLMEAEIAGGMSAEEAAGRHKMRTENLINEAVQSGFTEEQVRNLIGTYGDVPTDVITQAQFNAIQAKIDAKDLTGAALIYDAMTPEARAVFEKTAAAADVRAIKGELDRLDGKVVKTTIQLRTERSEEKILGRRARGGPVEAGEPYIVGEEGPELVIPKMSGTVIPAGPTAAMLGAAGRAGRPLGAASTGNGGGVVVNVQFSGSVGMDPGVVIDAVEEGVAKGMQMPKLRRSLVG